MEGGPGCRVRLHRHLQPSSEDFKAITLAVVLPIAEIRNKVGTNLLCGRRRMLLIIILLILLFGGFGGGYYGYRGGYYGGSGFGIIGIIVIILIVFLLMGGGFGHPIYR
jgi:Protein of unknown function (DUF3309)